MSAARRVVLAIVCLCACRPVAKPTPVAASQASPQIATETRTTRPATGVSRAPTPAEQATIAQLMKVTERIRGLDFIAPIAVRIEDRQAMRSYVSSALREPELERARTRYVALGVIEPDLDVRALLEALMEEELIGYYDPKRKLLSVRDDVARAMSEHHDEAPGQAVGDIEWRATVVHELVHALQDQHLGLGSALDQERSTDADDAFGALVEGDATIAMLAYASDTKGGGVDGLARDRRTLKRLLHAAPETLTGALRSAPAIVREPLLFRYREGALFTADLVRAGGYERVNAAYEHPPLTTREILDSPRFLEADGRRETRLPLEELLAAAALQKRDEDTLGSFEVGVVLSDDVAIAQTLALAWRADRYAVFDHEGALAALWIILADSSSNARKIEDAALARASRLGRDVSYAVLRRGHYVVIARRCSQAQVAALQTALDANTIHRREP